MGVTGGPWGILGGMATEISQRYVWRVAALQTFVAMRSSPISRCGTGQLRARMPKRTKKGERV